MFLCFLSNQEILYMTHHDWHLSYGIYDTITKQNQGQNHYLSLVPNYFEIYF